jgi:hypothetical protein
MKEQAKPSVFISYAHADEGAARKIGSALSRSGLKVWSDQEVMPGDNWSLKIGEALDHAKAMVVLISPDAMKSEGVRREIQFALASPNYAGRLIPVVVRPTKEMPWILRRIQHVRLGRNRTHTCKQIVERIQNPVAWSADEA